MPELDRVRLVLAERAWYRTSLVLRALRVLRAIACSAPVARANPRGLPQRARANLSGLPQRVRANPVRLPRRGVYRSAFR